MTVTAEEYLFIVLLCMFLSVLVVYGLLWVYELVVFLVSRHFEAMAVRRRYARQLEKELESALEMSIRCTCSDGGPWGSCRKHGIRPDDHD